MYMGTTSWCGRNASMACCAVTIETSCSTERPPKTTPTLSLLTETSLVASVYASLLVIGQVVLEQHRVLRSEKAFEPPLSLRECRHRDDLDR
jgi:hypothetical protein